MARKRSKRKSAALPYVVGGLALIVSVAIVSGIFYLWYKSNSTTPLDEAMCPVAGPPAVRIFLVDTTDPITSTTLTDARNRLEVEINRAKVGERLEIYGLTEKLGELTELFAGCKPDDGSQASNLISNPRLMKHEWEQFFAKPLAKVTDKLDQGVSGSQSPIMAAIQNIKLRVFDRFKDRDIPKKLIVLSDMIEHTQHYSQYRSSTDYQVFRQSSGYHEFRTDLTGVAVELWVIDRGIPRFRSSAHMDFWLNWVHGNQGEWQKAVPLEGVNPQVGLGESR